MKYLLMIYETPAAFDARTGDDREAFLGAWKSYADALKHAGHHVGGNGLEPPATGTTLRIRDGERMVQDGPYADTKEQLGGFFLIDVPDLDAALDWAARCPAAAYGVMEVRPVKENCLPLTDGAAETRAVLAR
jgi:hypothetical protein